MIQSLIDETNPSLIISFYPKFAVHPDHEQLREAVVRTVGRMIIFSAFSNDAPEILGEPDIQNDISICDIKLKAFEACFTNRTILKQLASRNRWSSTKFLKNRAILDISL